MSDDKKVVGNQNLCHIDDGMVWACPHCDEGGRLRVRTNGRNVAYTNDPEADYYCTSCEEPVRDPVERCSLIGQSRNGLAGQVASMDPEDVDL